jgi:hypothetical protein
MRSLGQNPTADRHRAGASTRPVRLPRARLATIGAGAFFATTILAAFRFTPSAGAVDLTPWEGISPFDDVLEGAGEAAGEIIKSGFEYIVNSLFGGVPTELTLAILRWLVQIPNFSGGSVREIEQTTSVIALALLACVMTISVARYWGAGLAGGGSGAGGFEGIARGVVAVAAIATWPFIFDLLSDLTGAAAKAVLSSEEMKQNLAQVLSTAIGLTAIPGAGLLVGIIIVVVGTVLLLCLVATKIIISAITVVIFVAAPLTFVLWVIPELGWIANTAMRVLAAVLAIPVIWALIFAAFGALWADTVLFRNNGEGSELGIAGSLADVAIVKPMVALALLYLAIVVPKRLVQMAPLLAGGGGPLAAARGFATYAAYQQAMPYVPQVGRGRAPGAIAQSPRGGGPGPRSDGGAQAPRPRGVGGQGRRLDGPVPLGAGAGAAAAGASAAAAGAGIARTAATAGAGAGAKPGRGAQARGAGVAERAERARSAAGLDARQGREERVGSAAARHEQPTLDSPPEGPASPSVGSQGGSNGEGPSAPSADSQAALGGLPGGDGAGSPEAESALGGLGAESSRQPGVTPPGDRSEPPQADPERKPAGAPAAPPPVDARATRREPGERPPSPRREPRSDR